MKKYRVFVVEDDDDDFDFLKEAFTEVGCTYDIQHYHTSDQLLAALSSSSFDQYPDLIVLDHQTPGRNGSEAVHQIRANKGLDCIALIVYSTTIPPTLQQKLLQQGVDLCTVKGNCAKDILNHVREFYKLVEKKKH